MLINLHYDILTIFFLFTTCISISQLILLSIFTLTSKIPTLSSNISLGKVESLSKTTSVIF